MSEFGGEITEGFKKHPYIIGGVALVVLILALKGSGGSSAASSSSQGFAAGLQALSLQEQGAIASQQIAAGQAVQQANTSAAAHVADNQTLGQVLGTLVSAKVSSAQTADQFALQTQQTKAAQDVATTQLNDSLTLGQQTLGAQVDTYGKLIGLQTQALGDQTQLANRNLDITNANLPSVLAFNEYLAGVNQGTTLGVAQIQGQTAQNVAQTNANVAYANAASNAASKGLGGISSLFNSIGSLFG